MFSGVVNPESEIDPRYLRFKLNMAGCLHRSLNDYQHYAVGVFTVLIL